jgi:hypothetical protein
MLTLDPIGGIQCVQFGAGCAGTVRVSRVMHYSLMPHGYIVGAEPNGTLTLTVDVNGGAHDSSEAG